MFKSLYVTIKNGLQDCDDLPCYAAPCETTKMLYRISQNAYAKILDQDASVLEELKNLSDMYYKQYEKVLTMVTDDGLPRSAIKEYASQSLQYSIEQNKTLVVINLL